MVIDDSPPINLDPCPPSSATIVVDGDETAVETPVPFLLNVPLTSNHLWKRVEVEAISIL